MQERKNLDEDAIKSILDGYDNYNRFQKIMMECAGKEIDRRQQQAYKNWHTSIKKIFLSLVSATIVHVVSFFNQ